MATSDDNSDDDLTVPELRSRLIAAAHSDAGDVYGSKPLVEATQRRLFKMIEGEELAEDLNSNQVQFKLLSALGEFDDPAEFLKRGKSPFRKHELQAMWNKVHNEDAGWGPVGSESVESDESLRHFREPDSTERRFQVLASLAVHGPVTASELVAKSSVPRESVTSELPRLYKDFMAGRTKRDTFEDVFKYWVRPEGLDAVRGTVEGIDEDQHEELHELYGESR